MKLGELLNKSTNSKNKQSIWNPKKRKLKELNLTEDDLLNIKINFKLKEIL